MRLTTAILLILISVPVFAQANDYIAISKQLTPLIEQNDILILGEKHGKQESTKLFTALTNYLTQNDTCLSVALEIGSDQQSVIDMAMSGTGGPISDIKISSIIDHPAYREMLSDIRQMVAEGRCLHVVAIDAPPNVLNRDAWMAEVMSPYIGKGKVLCLLGRLHGIKKIRWDSGNDNPFLAERLVADGYSVCSVMQLWDGKGDGTVSRLTIDDVARVLDPVAAHMPEDASEFGDYVVKW